MVTTLQSSLIIPAGLELVRRQLAVIFDFRKERCGSCLEQAEICRKTEGIVRNGGVEKAI